MVCWPVAPVAIFPRLVLERSLVVLEAQRCPRCCNRHSSSWRRRPWQSHCPCLPASCAAAGRFQMCETRKGRGDIDSQIRIADCAAGRDGRQVPPEQCRAVCVVVINHQGCRRAIVVGAAGDNIGICSGLKVHRLADRAAELSRFCQGQCIPHRLHLGRCVDRDELGSQGRIRGSDFQRTIFPVVAKLAAFDHRTKVVGAVPAQPNRQIAATPFRSTRSYEWLCPLITRSAPQASKGH